MTGVQTCALPILVEKQYRETYHWYFKAKSNLQEIGSLNKELMRWELLDFQRQMKSFDKREEILKQSEARLLDELEEKFSKEEFAMVLQFIAKENHRIESEYQSKLEKLDIPDKVKEILEPVKHVFESQEEDEESCLSFLDDPEFLAKLRFGPGRLHSQTDSQSYLNGKFYI